MASDTATIEIGSIREFGLPAIEALSSTFYPSGHRARRPEYLRWLYEENPCGLGEVVGARENGFLIGMMGLIPLRVQIGREIVVARMVVDVLTHPEHRNKNLFVRM